MKIKVLFTLSIFWVISGFAQFGSQQIISTSTLKPYLSIPFDIDNDGFMDVLTASEQTYKMSWYRNLDGLGNFGPEIIINEIPVYYLSVDLVDINNDGDMDILYHSNNASYIAWLENLDGAGNFGPEQIINEQDFIGSVTAKDMDNDGDQDLVAIVNNTITSKIVWYENEDGQGTFGEENFLIQNNNIFTKILVIDLDGDGILDILATDQVLNSGSIFWYKNLGNEIFGVQEIIYQFLYVQSGGTNIIDFRYVDINTDGKKDITITAEDEFGWSSYWFENIDNGGNFEPIQTMNTTDITHVFYDLDNDNDIDILYWNVYGGSIRWKENEDGLGNFGVPKLITTDVNFPRDTKAADFDGDGWLDITSASIADNKLAWYKNNTLGIIENENTHYQIYPNPTNGIVYIESKQPISRIYVSNILGQRIEVEQNTNQIDLSKAEAGIYLLNIESENGNTQTHKILKE